ncbi:MAG: hypothetical protein AB1427_14785 [Thermodesulfobacteriota bacterium]
MLKKYQPGRTDLLINTDWGIARDELTKEEAQSRNMRLFHGRWVTAAEKKRLKDEHHAYRSIRIMGALLILFALYIIIQIGSISRGGILFTFLAVIYALVALLGGIGLVQYKRVARIIAAAVFLSCFVLPLTQLFGDEKGAPFLIVMGVIGLYYILRRTARKILSPPAGPIPDGKKSKRSVFGKGISLIILLAVFFAGYAVYEMSRAERMAEDACKLATPGTPLEDFLLKFSEMDYRIIRNAEYVVIVPKKGMGRNHCTITHDGLKITGAKAGYAD